MDIEEPFNHINFLPLISVELSSIIILTCILLLLLVASALISGSEAALFSLSPKDREQIKEDESLSNILKLLKQPKELLATILITNNFVNVAIVIVSSALLQKLYKGSSISSLMQFVIETVIITFILLLFGEVIPKIYASKNALKFSSFISKPLNFINQTPPISWIKKALVKSSDFVQKNIKQNNIDISANELEAAIVLTKEEDTSEDDQKILEGIVNFGKTEVRQIMKPRIDVRAIDDQISSKELLEKILEIGHSRIPVYKENLDHIIGILFIKDLLPYIGKEEEFDWKKFIRPPFYVPENKKIDDLLKEFQEKKVHIAMVVDEYGGVSGIVTLEDILEEIVGDITDEFDNDNNKYTKIDDKTYLFEGKTPLIDLIKILDLDEELLNLKNTETIGGLIIEKAGKILMNNESIEIDNLKFIVDSSDKKRIKMVKIIIQDKQKKH